MCTTYGGGIVKASTNHQHPFIKFISNDSSQIRPVGRNNVSLVSRRPEGVRGWDLHHKNRRIVLFPNICVRRPNSFIFKGWWRVWVMMNEIEGVFGAFSGRNFGVGGWDFVRIEIFMLYRFIWVVGADSIKINSFMASVGLIFQGWPFCAKSFEIIPTFCLVENIDFSSRCSPQKIVKIRPSHCSKVHCFKIRPPFLLHFPPSPQGSAAERSSLKT